MGSAIVKEQYLILLVMLCHVKAAIRFIYL